MVLFNTDKAHEDVPIDTPLDPLGFLTDKGDQTYQISLNVMQLFLIIASKTEKVAKFYRYKNFKGIKKLE